MTNERGARLLGDFLASGAERCPDATLLHRENPRQERRVSYRELDADVRALAVGLLDHGLRPGDRVALFADNCRSWLLADQALARAGLVSVPRGTDSSPNELARIVEHSGAKLVLRAEHLEFALPVETRSLAEDEEGIGRLLTRGRALLQSSEGTSLLADARPDSHSLCTIVYTSGTTGRPKGVMLTHANLVSNVLAVTEKLHFPARGTMLSILPSWHMFERVFEYVALSACCSIIYTDTRRLAEDLRQQSPDIVAFVPRIWELLAGGIQKRVESLPRSKRFVVRQLRRLGRRAHRPGASKFVRRLHARLSRRLLAPAHAALGGKLFLGVSGGGALPEDVDAFLLEIGLPLLNGYGLTETSPVLTVRTPDGNRTRSIGPALPRTEIRIIRDGRECGPGEVGEIHARGPQIMQGYYQDEDATRAVLDADGWFRTGDLGSRDADGWFAITGRIKDTIVLAGGENVEPEPIECHVKTSPWIDQIMLVGQDCKVVGALVVVNEEHCREVLGAFDPSSDALRATLRREFDRLVAASTGFRKIDRVGPFAVLGRPFSTEDGTMTATLKLKRHVIHERFADEIEALYK